MKSKSLLLSLILSLSVSSVALAADEKKASEPAAPAAPVTPVVPAAPASPAAPAAPAAPDASAAKDAEKAAKAQEKAAAKEAEKQKAKEKASQKEAEKASEKEEKAKKEKPEPAAAAPAAPETLIDLSNKHGYKTAWASMFKGEWSIPNWIQRVEANSAPVIETTGVDGQTYVLGSMCKSSDCANDRLIAIFSKDHKQAWSIEITVPAGLGKDGERHPKKYASLHFYGNPDVNMKKVLMGFLEKDPTWK